MAGTLSAGLWRVKSGELYAIRLRDLEPNRVNQRPIKTKGIVATDEIPMLTFQLIGLALVALFFGAIVSGKQKIVDR